MEKTMDTNLSKKIAVSLLFKTAEHFSFLKNHQIKSIKLLSNRRELAILTKEDKLFIVYYLLNFGWLRYQEHQKDFSDRESFECIGDDRYIAGAVSDIIHQHLDVEKEYHFKDF